MRVQVFICGLLIDPLCNVGTDFLVSSTLSIGANKLLECVLKLLCGAAGVDWEYFVRLVVTTLLEIFFVPLHRFYGNFI